MTEVIKTQSLTRRQMLGATAAGIAVVAGSSLFPNAAQADAASMKAAIKKLVNKDPVASDKVKLKLPEIAENGSTVPFTVTVDSPMTDSNYCKAVHLFADGNPNPDVASFRFTPASGVAKASSRMRLAKTQNIVAVAEMSDGSVHMATQLVKVTIGGCGG